MKPPTLRIVPGGSRTESLDPVAEESEPPVEIYTPADVQRLIRRWQRIRNQAFILAGVAALCALVTVLGMLWIADVCLRQLAR